MKIAYAAVALLAVSACKKKEEEAKDPKAAKDPGTAKDPKDPATGKDPGEAKPAVDAGGAAAPAGDAGAAQGPAAEVIKVEGFDTPESVLHDEAADVYLVSNIGGQDPLGKDDNGFISKLTPDGKAEKWIDGAKEDVQLDAPKGMAIVGDTLYVTDIDVVRKFDKATGAAKGEIEIEGATFLNDLAAGEGTIWVSDTGLTEKFEPSGSAAIWQINVADDKATKVLGEGAGAPAAELGAPNGLVVEGDAVWVATFGSGEVYKVTVEGGEGAVTGKRADIKKLPKGQLDGLAVVDGVGTLVSSWEEKAIYAVGADGEPQVLIKDVESPADFGVDAKRKRVIIPLFTKNVVEIHTLP